MKAAATNAPMFAHATEALISRFAAGNAFLPAFMEQYNARFAKAPLEDRDVHRPLAGHDDLDDAFAWKEERTVSMNLTLQYDQVLFILLRRGASDLNSADKALRAHRGHCPP